MLKVSVKSKRHRFSLNKTMSFNSLKKNKIPKSIWKLNVVLQMA